MSAQERPEHKPGKKDKDLVLLHGELKSPPLSTEARRETGYVLRRLQRGEKLGLPHSRPMPSIGRRCHELRITDADKTWRIIYRTDEDAIVIVDVFEKKTQQTPKAVLERCQGRLRSYDKKTGQ
jgi:phage-related protein